MRRRLIAIAVLLGCGGGSDETSIDIKADQNNVCDEVAEVACHNMYQCCAEGEIQELLGVSDPRSEEECREDVSRRCVRAIAARDFGIQEAHVRFDAEIMNDCLEALIAPDDTCATVASELPWSDACVDSAWVGLVQDGGACLSTLECASKDSVCGGSQTCVALPVAGQPCGVGGCATGAFCDLGTCVAQIAAGDACTSTFECREGLFCDTTTVVPVCTPLHAPGEACTSSAACASSQCNPGTCAGSTQTCFTDANCTGRCEESNAVCASDASCSTGSCSLTPGSFCLEPADCVGAGNVCVFPDRCIRGDCVGDAVCAERHLVVDYCEGALDSLPVPVVDNQAGGSGR